ncbi:MAG TPA: tetratricopeptide repeat protein [Planctomycetaceae bacterium]|jgi:Tfp pilus assembly protein PilF
MRVPVRTELTYALCLAGLIGVAFWPALRCEFVNFDDPQYVINNPLLKDGLTVDRWWEACTTYYEANWHPLTWHSLMLDASLFGMRPAGFHLTNLILHFLTVWVLFLALRNMTGDVAGSVLIAAVFAVHPLHVESVAWVTERKDVLSGLFWMLGLLAYARYARAPSITGYFTVTLMFILGLASKPMNVTFPCVLLLLDFWPLRRHRSAKAAESMEPPPFAAAPFSRLAIEKLPWMMIALVSSYVTVLAQRAGGAVRTLEESPLERRLVQPIVAYVMYLWKTVWPAGLSVFYPDEAYFWPLAHVLAALALLMSVTWVCWKVRSTRPAAIVGWLWFLGTLIPVLGMVKVGKAAFADRYMYVPQVGLLLLAVWGWRRTAPETKDRGQSIGRGRLAFATLLVTTLAVATSLQARHWRNSFTLFEHSLAVNSDNWLAHYNLGVAHATAGDFDRATPHYEAALHLRPAHPNVRNLLGISYARADRLDEAIAVYREGLKLNPRQGNMRVNLANALARKQEFAAALLEYREADRQMPGDPRLLLNLANCEASAGRRHEALAAARQALSAAERKRYGNLIGDIRTRISVLEQESRSADGT